MRFSKRNLLFLILSLGVMGIIFWFSSRDATASTEQSDRFIVLFLRSYFNGEIPAWLSVVVRKSAHFAAYAALGCCLFLTFEGAVTLLTGYVSSFVTSVLYAVSDELHQVFVPGRAGRFFDLLVDSAGALFGIFFAAAILWIIRKRRSCR